MTAPDTVPQRLTPTIGLDDAATLLRCSPETVRKMAKAGELPGTKVGRAWVFYTEQLHEWLRARIETRNSGRDDPMRNGNSGLVARLEARLAQRSAARKNR